MSELVRFQPSSVTAQRLVEAFFSGKKRHTVAAYQRDLRRFAKWRGCEDLDEVARMLFAGGPGEANATVLEFKNAELAQGLASATVNRRLASIRALVDLARTLGVVNWTLSVDNVDPEAARDMSGPSREDVLKILRHLDGRCTKGDRAAKRNRAIVSLLYHRALRVGEVVELNVAHVELYSAQPRVSILGKGRRQREWVDIPKVTADALQQWLLAYPSAEDVRPSGTQPLFCNFDRDPGARFKRLHVSSVRDMVARVAKDAGVTVPVRPHGFRHSAASWLFDNNGGNLRAVSEFMRHRSLLTTQRYDDTRKRLGIAQANLLAGDEGKSDARPPA
jgi:integrase/recombinase XerC